eukprot:scaffold116709_cov47-Prasinocladus_malaysianus.AAC.2
MTEQGRTRGVLGLNSILCCGQDASNAMSTPSLIAYRHASVSATSGLCTHHTTLYNLTVLFPLVQEGILGSLVAYVYI